MGTTWRGFGGQEEDGVDRDLVTTGMVASAANSQVRRTGHIVVFLTGKRPQCGPCHLPDDISQVNNYDCWQHCVWQMGRGRIHLLEVP